MLGMSILGLVSVVLSTIVAVFAFKDNHPGGGTALLFIVIMLGILTIVTARESYRGHHLTAISLSNNEIYETVGAAEDDSTFYVTLREHDKDIRTFQLGVIPPPIFKVIRISHDSVLYRPYPTEH